MSQMLNSIVPKLLFSDSENIADGVIVSPILFALKKTNPPFKATYFEVLPGCETPLDQHQVEEFWIVLKGNGTLKYENESYPIFPQDIFYFAPFKKHQVYNDSDNTLIIFSLYW